MKFMYYGAVDSDASVNVAFLLLICQSFDFVLKITFYLTSSSALSGVLVILVVNWLFYLLISRVLISRR